MDLGCLGCVGAGSSGSGVGLSRLATTFFEAFMLDRVVGGMSPDEAFRLGIVRYLWKERVLERNDDSLMRGINMYDWCYLAIWPQANKLAC
jgi:hypothetical protein